MSETYEVFDEKSLNTKLKSAKTPFFYIYKNLKNASEKVTVSVLLKEYADIHGCSIDEAKKVFYLEQTNYSFERKGDNVYVGKITFMSNSYYVLKTEYLNRFCNATTNAGLRCKQYKPVSKTYCTQHAKSLEKKNNLVSSKKLDRNIIPQFLLDEKDIEKLRDVCITVYMNYHHQWDNIIRRSQKRNKNREALSKINKLQLQINKLREELE